MAQIINHNPEDNPQLNELYEILLMAGYFRIRIASLKAFDKVIGGMAWCITSSNFSIEVDYSDEMQIGQKIKVSERICQALKSMQCQYSLQAFQLQGLDVNNIYPVIQWLVKLVYETRMETLRYNRDLSYMLGSKILGYYDKGNADRIPPEKHRRVKINRQMATTSYYNPLRVYSALLQFDDKSSLRMYNKLLHLSAKKQGKVAGKQGKKDQRKDDISNLLQEDDKEVDGKVDQSSLKDFGSVGKMSLDRLERIIQDSKNQIEQGIIEEEDQDEEEEEEQATQPNQTNQSKETGQQQSNDPVSKQNKKDKMLKAYRVQNEKYQTQLQALNSQMDYLANLEKQLKDEVGSVRERYQTVSENLSLISEQKSQLDDMKKQIDHELKDRNIKVDAKLEGLVDKRMKLKKRKTEIKKKAKAKLEDLQKNKEISISAIPEIDEEAFNKMLEESEVKKKIYNQKYERLTTVNQELAILQRKAENFTSPAEIAQYHQRFVQLFEAINYLIEQKRSMYSETSNLESSERIVGNYLKILNDTKENFREAKKKAEKKELSVSLKQILMGMEANMTNSISTLGKMQSQRQQNYGEYLDLIKQEREYLKQLRNLKIEYENAENFYRE